MEIIIPALLVLSLLLLIISFFLKDPYKELRNEFDQYSMQHIQELYQVKRKIKILEEELLMGDQDFPPPPSFSPKSSSKKEIHAIIKNQVWTLAQQGVSIEQISMQSSLSPEDVKEIVLEFSMGEGDE